VAPRQNTKRIGAGVVGGLVVGSAGKRKSAGVVGGLKCKTCGQTFQTKEEFQTHNKKSHGGKGYGILIHEE
jgi:hypothetical protein